MLLIVFSNLKTVMITHTLGQKREGLEAALLTPQENALNTGICAGWGHSPPFLLKLGHWATQCARKIHGPEGEQMSRGLAP